MANNRGFPIASGLRRSGMIRRHNCYAKSDAGPSSPLADQCFGYAKDAGELLLRLPFTPERVP
jgi:hypothetical protein